MFARNIVGGADENPLAHLVRQARVAWAAIIEGAFPVGPGVWQAHSSVGAPAAAATSASEESFPASEDELALAFLCQHNYDVPRARLLLAASLGAGTSVLRLAEDPLYLVHVRRIAPILCRHGARCDHASVRAA